MSRKINIPNYAWIILFACLLFNPCSGSEKIKRPVDYVNPFICTKGDHGQWLPAALVPFGLVELCPDTYPGSLTGNGDCAHSGYDFSDRQIRGFSNFHKGSSGGTSIVDRAGFLSVIPFVNATDTFYRCPVADIDKKTEKASPGYYAVALPKENIEAELTALTHVGVHKYTFQKGQAARLFLYEGNHGQSKGISFKFNTSVNFKRQFCRNPVVL